MTYGLAMLLFNAARRSLLLYALHAAAARAAAQPAGHGRRSAPDLAFNTAVSFVTNTNWQSYGGETHHELPRPDGRPDGAELPVRRDRHRAGGGAGPRLRPRCGRHDRQFLGRSHPLHALRAAADLASSWRCSWSGRACRRTSTPMRRHDARRRPAGDRAGAGRLAGGDQDARHQRRRLLQRQLGASLREPDAARQLRRRWSRSSRSAPA